MRDERREMSGETHGKRFVETQGPAPQREKPVSVPALIVILLPFIYLAYVWHELPARVPMHWNIHGEIDRYGNKTELILIPFILPVLIYLIFLAVPYIDPKNKIKNMGNKYQNLKILVTVFMSALAIYIIYSVKTGTVSNPNYIFILLGILYSTIPPFHHSTIPSFHHSTIPLFHHSIIPPFHLFSLFLPLAFRGS